MSAENVSEDPRWQAFNQDGFLCSCGERHVGLFPVNMLTPAAWDGPKEYAPDEDIQLDRTFISESYCVWQGQNFAMRMRLPLQMRGAAPAARQPRRRRPSARSASPRRYARPPRPPRPSAGARPGPRQRLTPWPPPVVGPGSPG